MGLIGGSMLRRLTQADGLSAVGYDLDPEVRAQAELDGAEVAGSSQRALRGAEAVVVAVPPAATHEVVLEALDAGPHSIVTDVASVKAPILRRVLDAAPTAEGRYLPSHPLAGAETSGWRASHAGLLDGTVWALCPPTPKAPLSLLCRWGAVFAAFGARLAVLDAEEHDAAVALSSHVPHVVAQAMAAGVSKRGDALAALLSGGALRDTVRTARSGGSLWWQILTLNRGPVQRELQGLIERLQDAQRALATTDADGLERLWDSGAEGSRLVQDRRWRETAWEERVLHAPAWPSLAALAREGRAIRHPRLQGDELTVEVSVASGGSPEPGPPEDPAR